MNAYNIIRTIQGKLRAKSPTERAEDKASKKRERDYQRSLTQKVPRGKPRK